MLFADFKDILKKKITEEDIVYLKDNDALDMQNEEGYTVTMLACSRNQINIVLAAIELGADLDKLDYKGNNMLILAILNDSSYEMIELLIDLGISVSCKNKIGNTPLMCSKDIRVSKMIIDKDPTLVNQRCTFGYSPLSWAVFNGDIEHTQLFLDHNANVNHRDDYLNTPIFYAINKQNSNLVINLLARGANVDIENSCRETPLNIAISLFPIMVLPIINASKKLDFHDEANSILKKNTLLIRAIKHKLDIDIIEIIMAQGNINKPGFLGRTALFYAAKNNDKKLVEKLLYYGADITIRDEYGYTAYDYNTLMKEIYVPQSYSSMLYSYISMMPE